MAGNDAHTIIDERALTQYKARVKELEDQISIAERNNDIGTHEKAKKEYDDLLSYLKNSTSLRGKPRTLRTNDVRIKDKITKAIERAVSEIKKHDSEIAEHFKKALYPINSFKQCYNPSKEIHWQFED